MIYSVTLNPTLDYYVKMSHFLPGEINRCQDERLIAGGKGLNVSLMLNVFEVSNIVVALVAGATGQIIENYAKKEGCQIDFIHLENGFSRLNIKISAKENTEINGAGPIIDKGVIDKICNKLQHLTSDDYLVLAGSVTKNAPFNIYTDILEFVCQKTNNVIVDTTGIFLRNSLKYKPFLIKPNIEELGELFNVKIEDTRGILHFVGKLQAIGAQNVLVSRGSNGSIFVAENGSVYEGNSPGGAVVNTVGCGDAMVAGFIAGYLSANNKIEAYKVAIGSSCARAISESTVTIEDIECILPQVIIKELKEG